MTKKMIAGGALGLVLAGSVAGFVSAQSAAEATGLTEDQIIEIALAEIPGELEEIELEREDGAMVYEVEILTAAGTEMELEINAETGEILEVEEEREGRRGRDCDKDRTGDGDGDSTGDRTGDRTGAETDDA